MEEKERKVFEGDRPSIALPQTM